LKPGDLAREGEIERSLRKVFDQLSQTGMIRNVTGVGSTGL
jgi:hypothetical protein